MTYDFTDGQFNAPADGGVVEGLSSRLGVSLPNDYLAFLKQHNGGSGLVGTNFIILWKAEELEDFNREYEVEKYAPGILLFGSNGGGDGYGFDTYSNEIPLVCMPFIGMARDYAEPAAKDLADLFAKLAVMP